MSYKGIKSICYTAHVMSAPITQDEIRQIKVSTLDWIRKNIKKKYIRLVQEGLNSKWPSEQIFIDLHSELDKFLEFTRKERTVTEKNKAKEKIDDYIAQYFDIHNIENLIRRDKIKFQELIKLKF